MITFLFVNILLFPVCFGTVLWQLPYGISRFGEKTGENTVSI